MTHRQVVQRQVDAGDRSHGPGDNYTVRILENDHPVLTSVFLALAIFA